jgi:hypothetical protein
MRGKWEAYGETTRAGKSVGESESEPESKPQLQLRSGRVEERPSSGEGQGGDRSVVMTERNRTRCTRRRLQMNVAHRCQVAQKASVMFGLLKNDKGQVKSKKQDPSVHRSLSTT